MDWAVPKIHEVHRNVVVKDEEAEATPLNDETADAPDDLKHRLVRLRLSLRYRTVALGFHQRCPKYLVFVNESGAREICGEAACRERIHRGL